jgi:hypothetical protein
MSLRSIQSLGGLVALAVCLQCAHSQVALQGLNPNESAVVNFPKPFVRSYPVKGRIVVASLDYEIRKSNGSRGSELLFGMKDDDEKYSDNFFGVGLDSQFNVTPVNREEWNRAERLQPTKRFDVRAHETTVSGDSVQYRNKLFKKSGRSFETTAALASTNGRWLAVFSHTSEKNVSIPGPLGGGGPGKGEMFVDVYEVSSGKQILSAHAPHRGGDQPGRYFDATVWVNDKYLIVPLDVDPDAQTFSVGDRILLVIMPGK